MHKITDILRLKFDANLSHQKIARAIGLSKGAVTRTFVICIKEDVYLVLYVENEDEVFLKTIIPSRKFTKLYLGGGL